MPPRNDRRTPALLALRRRRVRAGSTSRWRRCAATSCRLTSRARWRRRAWMRRSPCRRGRTLRGNGAGCSSSPARHAVHRRRGRLGGSRSPRTSTQELERVSRAIRGWPASATSSRRKPDGFLERPAFRRGVACLERYGLTYDILVYARQLPAAVAFARAFPRQRFVLDHLGKPDIRANAYRGVAAPFRRARRRFPTYAASCRDW